MASTSPPPDWESFRTLGKEMIDVIADYYKTIHELPVKSQVSPGYLRELLPKAAPEAPEDFAAVMKDVHAHIVPGITHWQHPSFFGFFPANSSPPALLGDMLSGMFNTIGFSWMASPALTELESIVLDWFAQLIGLPLDSFGSSGKGAGIVQGTASEATLVALLAAKARVLHAEKAKALAAGEPFDELAVVKKLCLYHSDQAHSSVKKASMIAGMPETQTRTLVTTSESNYALDPTELERAMRQDVEKGLIPCFVVLTFGTTSSGACDPLRKAIEVARNVVKTEHPVWCHVDAAWAGSALICEEYRHLADGISEADSLVTHPHKWLKTNFDCSLMWTSARKWLIEALSITPEYLRSKAYDEGLVTDYRDLQVPLGRRFRALKLWLVLRMEGSDALKAYIREHVRLAQEVFAPQLTAMRVNPDDSASRPLFELPVPPSLSLVCFRLVAPERTPYDRAEKLQETLLNRLNASGKLFLVHTKLAGKGIVLRMAIGGALTKQEHVNKALKDIEETAREVLTEDKEGLLK
jgi:aromatic-L-amino-acid/L-tryptophan decarboxylase